MASNSFPDTLAQISPTRFCIIITWSCQRLRLLGSLLENSIPKYLHPCGKPVVATIGDKRFVVGHCGESLRSSLGWANPSLIKRNIGVSPPNYLEGVLTFYVTLLAPELLTHIVNRSFLTYHSIRLATSSIEWCLHKPQVMLSVWSGTISSWVILTVCLTPSY